MNRSKCFSVVDYAHAAAHSATLAASYSGINKERSDHFGLLAEEALNAALEALFEARLSQAPSFLAVAAEVTQPMEIAA